MKKTTAIRTGVAAAAGMLILILDSDTALQSAQNGVNLCIYTIIPSLFPFFVLSGMLTATLSGNSHRLVRPLGKLLGMPSGSETLFLTGILGGYPAGAQCIVQAWEEKWLDSSNASRLMGFCSNAGPAFLFGIVAQQFQDPKIPWILWGIHIFSAVASGMLLPRTSSSGISPGNAGKTTLSAFLDRSLIITARVCGWVVLFRMIIGFLQRWLFQFFPVPIKVLIAGILELSNGCCILSNIEQTGLRFILCSVMLSLGGICVLMQTMSITGKLGLGMYLPGKLLQTAISFQTAVFYQRFFLPTAQQANVPPILCAAVWILLLAVKISVAFPRRLLYNTRKQKAAR